MKPETCDVCRFWHRGDFQSNDQCRRRAPQLVSLAADTWNTSSRTIARFPPASAKDWCGEWQEKGPTDE